MDDSELTSVCKEDIVAKFKDVSLHLYDVNGQDNIYKRIISVPSEQL